MLYVYFSYLLEAGSNLTPRTDKAGIFEMFLVVNPLNDFV